METTLNPLAIITKRIPFKGYREGAIYQTRDGLPVELWRSPGDEAYPAVGKVNGSGLIWRHADDVTETYGRLFEVELAFPEPPAGEKWHNPERLTAAQVGVGYRLLVVGETPVSAPQAFYHEDARWFTPEHARIHDRYSYRVPDDMLT